MASCLGGLCSNLMTTTATALSSSSLGTRLIYAGALLFNSLLSWFAMSTNKTLLWPNRTCTSTGECGFLTVHRLNFASGLMHIILAVSLAGVKSTRNNIRASWQNSWWSAKIFLYLLLVVLAFRIPNEFYIIFSKWISMPSGVVFILVGLILLVDFAHEWAEVCLIHIEAEDEHSEFWKKVLVSGTSLMYTSSIAMTVAMYIIFCNSHCHMNQAAVTINLLFSAMTMILSIHPSVQAANPKSGLAQSSMVSLYGTYLTLSAIVSEPDDKLCNPLVRHSGTRRVNVILGSLFTFIAIAYTTTRAAANSAFQTSIHLNDDNLTEYEGLGGQTRNQLRIEAIRQAVEEGSLPESAIYDTRWLIQDSGDSDSKANDDELGETKYNYTLFHVIFFLATQWIAILLTINVTQDDVGDFIPVGRTYFYSWVKILSAWICYGLFAWSIIVPVLMPDRFEYGVGL